MLNFKNTYQADMQKVKPSPELLAKTQSLLLAPTSHRTPRFAIPVAISAAALLFVAALPHILPGEFQNQPTELLADNSSVNSQAEFGIATASVDTAIESDEQPVSRSAMQHTATTLSSEELGGLAQYSAFLPTEPSGMTLFSAQLFAEEDTLLVDYSDGGYDYLTLRISPLAADEQAQIISAEEFSTLDNERQGEPPIFAADDFSLEIFNQLLANGDQGASWGKIYIACNDYLLEYTTHTANPSAIGQAILAAKFFN